MVEISFKQFPWKNPIRLFKRKNKEIENSIFVSILICSKVETRLVVVGILDNNGIKNLEHHLLSFIHWI